VRGTAESLTAGLWIAWQPIRLLATGQVWAYEALIRGPRGSSRERPETLFRLAAERGQSLRMERACRAAAFGEASRVLPEGVALFVNLDSRYLDLAVNPEGAPWPPRRTVLEVSERFPLDNVPALATAMAIWRNAGYRVALDDFGAGYAGLTTLISLRPEVVKLDRTLVRGLFRDRWHRTVVAGVVSLLAQLGVIAVAEGIETERELSAVRALGVEYGQGYALGPPSAWPEGLGLCPVAP
jgi:EAL domain-containing protein (putative c-di-GMP-specific phosphodiesterase class I)